MKKIALFNLLLTGTVLFSTASCGGSRNITPAYPALPQIPPSSQPVTNGNYPSQAYTVPGDVWETPKAEIKTKDLNILTFNIWGVLKYVTKSLEKRVSLINSSIPGFDLVNLQETTVTETKSITDTNPFYPHKVRYDNTSFMKWGSGLSTLSLYPVKEQKFMKFSDCAALDCNNNKGVLLLRIEVPELGMVDIYNTHYQSMPWSTKIRLQANRDFEKFYQENNTGNLTIITGDFNFTEKDDDYKDFLKRFKAIDTFRTKYPDDPGYTYDRKKNKNAFRFADTQRLDYIFVIPNEKYEFEILDSKLMFTESQQDIFLSDHFGLVTSLRISRKVSTL